MAGSRGFGLSNGPVRLDPSEPALCGPVSAGLDRIRYQGDFCFTANADRLRCLGGGFDLGIVANRSGIRKWLEMVGTDRAMQVLMTCFVGVTGYGLTLLLLGRTPATFFGGH